MVGTVDATRAPAAEGYRSSISDQPETRKVSKTVYVTVDVEVTPSMLANTLTRAEVISLCTRHNIALKGGDGSPGSRVKLSRDELANISDDIRRGHVEDALIRFERILPREFSHLSEDVARYFRRRG